MHGTSTRHIPHGRSLRRTRRHRGRIVFALGGVLAGGVGATGALLAASALPASAHANVIVGTASCATPGSGYVISWTVSNDYNLSESIAVTSATGGLATVNPLSAAIAASGNGSGGNGTLPYRSALLTQRLPVGSSSPDTISVLGIYSDGFEVTNSGTVTLPTNCVVTTTTLATPTTTTSPHTTTTIAHTTTTVGRVTSTTSGSTATTTTAPAVVTTVNSAPVTTTTAPVASSPTTIPGAPSSFTVLKTERVGSSGPFVRGPIDASVGEALDYRIVVRNTGATALVVSVSDSECDAGTLRPSSPMSLRPGQAAALSCSHRLLVVPLDHLLLNIASATATTASGTEVGTLESDVPARIVPALLKAAKLPAATAPHPVVKTATFTG